MRSSKIARQHGLVLSGAAPEAVSDGTTLRRERGTTVSFTSIGSALTVCDSREQRLRRALELLVENAGAQHGELFIVSEVGLGLAHPPPVASVAPITSRSSRASSTPVTQHLEHDRRSLDVGRRTAFS